MVKQSTISSTTLTTISNLFRELHDHDIIYCHWKAHDVHMLSSLSGDSDLDILFDFKQKSKLESVLQSVGFKKFEPVKQKQYEDIADYLILDNDSRKLVHLHAHFKIRPGKLFLKEYDLNLEQRILHSRLFNVQYHTFCIQPSYQLILLYLIESLKLRNRDQIRFLFNRKRKLNAKVIGEYQWLKANTNLEDVKYFFHEILNHPEPVNNLIDQELSLSLLFKLANNFELEFSDKKEYIPVWGLAIRWYRELILVGKKILSKILAQPIPMKRVNPRGGRILVFYGKGVIGLDAVQNVFGKKLDVFRISFDARKNSAKLSLTRSEKRKLKRMESAREKGMLVICDQFPVDLEAGTDRFIPRFLPDIFFKWLNDGDEMSIQKPWDNSNNRLKIIPISPAASVDTMQDLLISETWKLL